MTPVRHLPAASADAGLERAVIALATARATPSEIPKLRTSLQPPGKEPIPVSLLKHADEQTVVGLAAVFGAIRRYRLETHNFDQWAVLAAPRFLGREATATTIQRYMAEGAWGVSPHMIPQRSLHSASGTISLALKLRGPNFGVSGGPSGVSQALRAAIALLADGNAPGVWIVASGWNPELIPFTSDDPQPTCAAAAMALTSCPVKGPGSIIRLTTEVVAERNAKEPVCPSLTIESLVDMLERSSRGRTQWRLGGGSSLEFDFQVPAPEIQQ